MVFQFLPLPEANKVILCQFSPWSGKSAFSIFHFCLLILCSDCLNWKKWVEMRCSFNSKIDWEMHYFCIFHRDFVNFVNLKLVAAKAPLRRKRRQVRVAPFMNKIEKQWSTKVSVIKGIDVSHKYSQIFTNIGNLKMSNENVSGFRSIKRKTRRNWLTIGFLQCYLER